MIDRPRLLDLLTVRPLVLDAAMGTRLVALGLDLGRDDPAFWNLSRPDSISSIHALDVAAGADVLLTNTFGANRRWLARFGRDHETISINRRACSLARAAAGPNRHVLASIGPSAADDPSACVEQAELLADLGADAILFETHTFEQAVRSLRAVARHLRIPRIVSLISWPDPIGDAAARLEDEGAAVLGVNCERGMERSVETARRLAQVTALPMFVKPSAGLPDEPLERPEAFRAAVPALLSLGVRLIGGCCGTTDAHVAAIRAGCYDASAPKSPAQRNATA